ncbi:hypothetical protein GGR53DRAFT_117679 [Hypoxylon sp. FL1150]|nr:hypothetical protein GGR53DRAFT_117679 [Hypoxylon sp. FL1150]
MSADALSLACNIITLIDFSHKLYETYRDISDNGEPDKDAQQTATELSKLVSKVKDSQKNASLPKNDQLDRVADQCLDAATKLQKEMAKITPSTSSSRIGQGWQDVVSTAKRIWRHARLEQMKKTMETCQRTMLDVVLVEMYESGQAERLTRRDEFTKLDTRLQNFIQALAGNHLQISNLLAENRALHEDTRNVVHKEIVALRDAQVSDAELSRLKGSLKFSLINQRYNDVRPGHDKSFRWLFGEAMTSDADESLRPEWEQLDLQKLRNKTFGDFTQWLKLESRSSLYWISGKPGAGKSTLMKYLYQRMEEGKIIDTPYIVIRHFFWLGSSSNRSRQNDLEGMFSSLLVQLLNVEVHPGTTIAATLLQQNSRLGEKDTNTDWNLEELKVIMRAALRTIGRQYSIYILLDALDEHLPAADHEELLMAVKDFEDTPGVRLVISSRREPLFERYLAQSRQLLLQDLTSVDIYSFAADSLRPGVKAAFDDDSASKLLNDLVHTIVRKAQGVFLWARLAVDGVKRGLVDGNPEDELRERLHDLPSSLSDYFKSIWRRLGDDERRYRIKAANIFSLLLCDAWNSEPPLRRPWTPWLPGGLRPDILPLSFALVPQDARLFIQGHSTISGNGLFKICRHTQETIISHCAGLVELVPAKTKEQICGSYRFIHRTVADFLREEGREIINWNDLGPAGPDFCLMLAFLARCVAFRESGYDARMCDFLTEINSELWLSSTSPWSSIGVHFTEVQRHFLLTMYHTVHYRFCGHPENPRFAEWTLQYEHDQNRLFVIEAARYGHLDYAIYWIDEKANSRNQLR